MKIVDFWIDIKLRLENHLGFWFIEGSKKLDGCNESHKKEEEKEEKTQQYLKDLHITFDFEVPQKEVEPKNVITKLLGKKCIEEEFNVLHVTDLILWGLEKAKFRNISTIIIDGKTVYDPPEKEKDICSTITILDEYSHLLKNAKRIKLEAILKDPVRSTAIIQIKKIHTSKVHSIDIRI